MWTEGHDSRDGIMTERGLAEWDARSTGLAGYGRDNENFVLVMKAMCLFPLSDIKGDALG